MIEIDSLTNYADDDGNRIIFNGKIDQSIKVMFKGKNNVLHVHDEALPKYLLIRFHCNNGRCEIGKTRGDYNIHVGQDCAVKIDDNVTTTTRCFISTAEGTNVSIGKDCMLAEGIIIRTDDAHPIFDIESGLRTNPSRDIKIGNHVWLGQQVAVLGGTTIHDGSVIGFRAVVKGCIDNNCIAVGVPAKVVKKNIAWERPHLNYVMPYYKPDSSLVKKGDYWNPTQVNQIKSENANATKKIKNTLLNCWMHISKILIKK